MYDKHYPLCFESRSQYVEWVEAARREHPGRDGYCADCLPEFQSEMIREKRCLHPDTIFELRPLGKEEELVGRRSPKGKRGMPPKRPVIVMAGNQGDCYEPQEGQGQGQREGQVAWPR